MTSSKKTLVLLGILSIGLGWSSCEQQSESGKTEEIPGTLSADLVHNPRTLNDTAAESMSALRSLVFQDTIHDFGRIKEGEMPTYEFTFTNPGERDIIIYEAKGSCGCTVPEYPSEPIKKGKEYQLKVTFNSTGKYGYNDKTVMVTTNGNPAVHALHILAEVVK